MKKITSLLLITLLIAGAMFAMASCGEKEPETVTDITLSVAEDVPEIALDGTWQTYTPANTLESAELVYDYKYAGEDFDTTRVIAYDIIKYADEGMTATEKAHEVLETVWPEYAEDTEFVEDTNWETEGDYNFTYFPIYVVNDDVFGKPVYYYEYFFKSADGIYEYRYTINTELVDINNTNLSMNLPIGYERLELSELDIQLDTMDEFNAPTEDYANLVVFRWNSKLDFEGMAEHYERDLGADVVKYKTAMVEGGPEYDCFCGQFVYNYAGSLYDTVEYVCANDGEYTAVSFNQPRENKTRYQVASHSALINSLIVK